MTTKKPNRARTRAIRARMARTGRTWTWSARDHDAEHDHTGAVSRDSLDAPANSAEGSLAFLAAALSPDQVTELLGSGAAAWAELGVLVVRDGDDLLRVHSADGVLLGFVDLDDEPRYHAVYQPHPGAPDIVRPGGGIPLDPLRRRRFWLALHNPDDVAITILRCRDEEELARAHRRHIEVGGTDEVWHDALTAIRTSTGASGRGCSAP